MAFKRIIKDPDATLDYQVDWSDWLTASTDTIASVTWILPTGITEFTRANTTTTAAIWLSGGTLHKVYRITCRITTAAGRVQDYSFDVAIKTT